jgi:putative ABC transport system substrate-binding protein
MDRRAFVSGTLALLAAPLVAKAEETGHIPRVGHLLFPPSAVTTHLREAFRQGLRELGYVEGQNIVIEFRSADGRIERLPSLAAELVRLNVDVIVAAPDASVEAAQRATRVIPIIMAVSLDDPVERGFVAGLARPGGNITGCSTLQQELLGKRLELLKEVVPKLSRVLSFYLRIVAGVMQPM